MEEISLGAASIWVVCKAIRLDEKLTTMSLDGKDEQGGRTSIRVTSETVVKNKQTKMVLFLCMWVRQLTCVPC